MRSYTITPLEIVFWLWSSGFMIDELVDIGEAGISLYLMSLWNSFDVAIFALFVAYVCSSDHSATKLTVDLGSTLCGSWDLRSRINK